MAADDLPIPLMPDETAFRRILADQILRYPGMEIQDLYKLIFQASFGSEHAVSDRAAARRRLELELREAGHGPEEPLVDPISPNGGIVRINLRPYGAAGGDLAALLEAFVRTAREYRGAEATFQRYWGDAERMAAAGLLPFAREALQGFFAEMRAGGFPAVHHSDTYARTYRPAYRVIVRGLLASVVGSELRP
jgi:hypothetical protein